MIDHDRQIHFASEVTSVAEPESFSLIVPDVRMTLAHRVRPDRGSRPLLVRHWFEGELAGRPGRLLVSTSGKVIMDLYVPDRQSEQFSVDLPTLGCLEFYFDADRFTDHLHGEWELRIYSAKSESIAKMLGLIRDEDLMVD
ncbi:MAG: hypothetical protein CMI01_00515 [Oceanospirillaceae bacterium]|uniref:hypothetical protein n=1 Tax=Marinobacterium litorale TaxID=404770 RepID=UPI000407ED6F|nr:hypothetical protein [Marinobacterium litorale]MBS97149.1 hypothetical protein [Oceanospirillaceae bacterium]